MTDSYSNRVSRVLILVSLILCAFRFIYPGEYVFVSDEPNFQLTLQGFMDTKSIPATYCRGSSISFPYGAGALYFYLPIRLITHSATIVSIYNTLFSSLTLLFLFLGLRRLFGEKLAAWGLFAAACSPLLFFMSRHTWDNVLTQPISTILFYLFTMLPESFEKTKKHFLLLFLTGLVTGFGLTIHLMFGAVALASGLSILYYSFTSKNSWSTKFWMILAFGLGCAIFAVPYIYAALIIVITEKPLEASKFHKRWGDLRNLWWLLQRTVIFYSLWGSKNYLKTVEPAFASYVGSFWYLFYKIDFFGWIGKLGGWILPFYAIWNVIRNILKKKTSDLPISYTFAGLSFFSAIIVYNYLNIPTEPHYFNPICWLVFFGLVWLLSRLSKVPALFFKLTILLTALVNISFIFFSVQYFHKNHGARNMEFGTTLIEQERLAKDLCVKMTDWNWQRVNLDITKVFMHQYPMEYHFHFLKECQGKTLEIGPAQLSQSCTLYFPKSAELSTDASLSYECSQ